MDGVIHSYTIELTGLNVDESNGMIYHISSFVLLEKKKVGLSIDIL